MKKFLYEVRDKATNKTEKGEIQADSERVAGKLLLERGLVPLSIKEINTEGGLAGLTSRITTKDKIVFTRQFSTLVGAGLPIAKASPSPCARPANRCPPMTMP